MGEIVDILSKQPHLEGTCLCLECKHTWEGVAPIGVINCLECPNCECKKAVFQNAVFPMGEAVLTCECGNYHFICRTDQTKICTYCGLTHL